MMYGNLVTTMNEKEFIELLEKTTYFAAFSLLAPEFEDSFRENIKLIKEELDTNFNLKEDLQEWAIRLLLRESIDDYIQFITNNVFVKTINKEEILNES